MIEKLRLSFFGMRSFDTTNDSILKEDAPFVIRDLWAKLGVPPDGSLFWDSIETQIAADAKSEPYLGVNDLRITFRGMISQLCNAPWAPLLARVVN